MPIILESARITANGILKQDGEKLYGIKPLPHVEHLFETPQVMNNALPI